MSGSQQQQQSGNAFPTSGAQYTQQQMYPGYGGQFPNLYGSYYGSMAPQPSSGGGKSSMGSFPNEQASPGIGAPVFMQGGYNSPQQTSTPGTQYQYSPGNAAPVAGFAGNMGTAMQGMQGMQGGNPGPVSGMGGINGIGYAPPSGSAFSSSPMSQPQGFGPFPPAAQPNPLMQGGYFQNTAVPNAQDILNQRAAAYYGPQTWTA